MRVGKVLGLATLVVGVSLSVIASSPDSSMIVAAREIFEDRFAAARTPTVSELRVGETWVCAQFCLESKGIWQLGCMLPVSSLILEDVTDSSVTNHGLYPVTFFDRGKNLLGSMGSSVTELRISPEGKLLAERRPRSGGASVAYLVCWVPEIPAAVPPEPVCGFPGEAGYTIEERMADCHEEKTSQLGATIHLVARTSSGKEGKEVWRDDTTGLLWGDLREGGPVSWADAQKACKNLTEAEGEIPGLTWRLPRKDEYVSIGRKKDGGNEVWRLLPNMNAWFWFFSADNLYGAGGVFGGLFIFDSGGAEFFDREVRCVAR